MKKADQQIADKILSHQISLMRFSAGEKKKVLDLFLQMQAELKMKLASGFTSFEKERITKLLKECNEIIEVFYGKMSPAVEMASAVEKLKFSEELIASYGGQKNITLVAKTLAGKKAGTIEYTVADGEPSISMIRVADTMKRKNVATNLLHELQSKYPNKEIAWGWQTVEGTKLKQSLTFTEIKTADAKLFAEYNKLVIKQGELQAIADKFYEIKNPTVAQREKFLKATDPMNDIDDRIYSLQQKLEGKSATAKIITAAKTETQSTDLLGLAKAEAAATQTAIASIGIEASLPSAAVLKAMVDDTLLQGAPLKLWWQKQSEDLQFKYSSAIRQGVAQGETLQQIITRVAGSEKKGITGVLDISRRNASTLVHDSIMQIANDAKLAVYRENADILNGVEWLSTFDMHTCETCAAYHGAQWDLEGNPINGTTLPFITPPLHPNDRCVLTPVTKTYRELGIDLPEITGLTRASDLGQIPAGTSFSDFLDRHSKAEQDKFFGKGKAELWRSGKITLRDLVSQNGRPLTLKELAAQ